MTFPSAPRTLLLSLALLISTIPLAAQTGLAPGVWQFLGPDGGPIMELVAAPTNPQVLYAVAQGTFYRSTDGGATWTRGDDATFHVAADAVVPSLVYAVRPFQVARSGNGGMTWQNLDAPAWPVNQLVAHPRFAKTVYAVTDEGLFVSNNAGWNWKKLVQRGLPAQYQAYWLVIDPAAPRRFYMALNDIATGRLRLFKSLNGGATWQPIDSGPLRGTHVLGLATHPRSSRILYASTQQDLYKSVDGGRSWTAVGHAGGVLGITHLVAVQPDRPNVVYTAGGSGVFRSQDGGETWIQLALPQVSSASALLALRQSLFVAVSGFNHPGGLYKSTDLGSSWTFASRGIHALTVTSIQFGEPGTLWIYADLVLYRSTDQGLTWSVVHPNPASTLPVVAVATDPSDRSNVFVLISDGALWRSHDEGETWEAGGHAEMQALDLEVDPQNPSTLYAAGFGGIVKSTDAGTTWTPLPLPGGNAFYSDIDIAPSSPSTLYAAGNDGDFNTIFLRSQDGGATWMRLSLFNRDLKPPALAVDPLVATTVYSTDDGFVLRSTDAGETWSAVSDVVDSNTIHPIEIAASGRLYAAVWNLGVFALDEGSPTMISVGDRTLPWIFTALALDPHDPCRVYAGALHTSLLELTYTGTDECP